MSSASSLNTISDISRTIIVLINETFANTSRDLRRDIDESLGTLPNFHYSKAAKKKGCVYSPFPLVETACLNPLETGGCKGAAGWWWWWWWKRGPKPSVRATTGHVSLPFRFRLPADSDTGWRTVPAHRNPSCGALSLVWTPRSL
eukprot:2881079-Prymnesium_polylepis.1